MASMRVPNALSFQKQILIGLTFFFLSLMLFDWGFSGLQIGILMSAISFVQLFSSFPIGAINDRLSIRAVIITGMLLESAFFAGLFLFRDFWLVLFSFIAGGLGGNMIDVSVRSLTFKVLGNDGKGRKLGIYQIATTGGFGVGTTLGGLLLFGMSYSGVLLLTSVAFLLLAAASAMIPDVERIRFPMRDYRKIILRRSTALFLLPLFLFGIHWGAEHTSYSLFLRQDLGLGLLYSGLYMGIPVIILAAVSLYIGKRIDRKGEHHRTAFFAGLLLSGFGHIMMIFPPAPLSFAFRVIHEIGDGMAAVSYNLSFAKIFKVERIAGETSAAYTVMIIGNILGSLTFGPLGYAYGYAWPLAISGAVTLVSLAVLYLSRNRIGL